MKCDLCKQSKPKKCVLCTKLESRKKKKRQKHKKKPTRTKITCPRCNGNGWEKTTGYVPQIMKHKDKGNCYRCSGTGTVKCNGNTQNEELQTNAAPTPKTRRAIDEEPQTNAAPTPKTRSRRAIAKKNIRITKRRVLHLQQQQQPSTTASLSMSFKPVFSHDNDHNDDPKLDPPPPPPMTTKLSAEAEAFTRRISSASVNLSERDKELSEPINPFISPANIIQSVTYNPYASPNEMYSGAHAANIPTLISPASMEDALAAPGQAAFTQANHILHHRQQQQRYQYHRNGTTNNQYPTAETSGLPAFLTQHSEYLNSRQPSTMTQEEQLQYQMQMAALRNIYANAQLNTQMNTAARMYEFRQLLLQRAAATATATTMFNHLHQDPHTTSSPSPVPGSRSESDSNHYQPTDDQVEHPIMRHGGTDAYGTRMPSRPGHRSAGIEYTHVIHKHLGHVLDISNFTM